jgi:hypothetical protein
MSRVELYERSSLGRLNWPATPDGDYARRYLTPFMEHGPRTYIANAHTTLQVLKVDDVILPITPTTFHPANSYVCSPYTHYVTYGQEEFAALRNPPLEAALRLAFRPLAWYFRRAELDRVVYANNWLLSTNLYSALRAEQVTAALRYLAAAFPDRAVVFRSLDAEHNAEVYGALRTAGARMVFSRSVYYQDVPSPHVQRRQHYRRDLKHFERTPYTVVDGADLAPADVPRLLALYNDLYLRKYSTYNPQFTEAFISLCLQQRLLVIKAFQRDGRLDALLGYFTRGGLLTPPLFGYDTSLPRALGLYRLVTTLTALEGQRQGALVHFSAGVGPFKRARGGVNAIEYNAVYDAHLPAARRRPWALLQTLMDRAAIPLIRKYGF